MAGKTGVTRRSAMRVMLGTAGLLATGRSVGQNQGSPGSGGSTIEWSRLQDRIKGQVVSRKDPNYEQNRQSELWNALKPPRYPDAIVYVASEQDVREAVRFARKQRLKVAIRGGGHNVPGAALRQGGLLIDLSKFKAVQVDSAKRQAFAQPVAMPGDLLAALAPQGLAFPMGHCRTVPVSGYLLNGGLGWNSNAWGPACASVQGIEMVNAEGQSVLAGPEQNADLYWAARGAGPGFFGAVTRYHLQLHSMPRVIRTSTVTYRLDDVDRVADWLPDLRRTLPSQVELNGFIVSAPPQEKPSQGPPPKLFIVSAVAFADTEADAGKWLAPLGDGPQAPDRRQELLQPATFASLYDMTDRLFVENRRYAGEDYTFDVAPKEVLPRLRDLAMTAPSPESFTLLAVPSPPPAGVSPMPDMAFSMPGKLFAGVYAIWQDPGQDAANLQWTRQTNKSLESVTVGRYIGETDPTADAGRTRQSFAPANWQRLQQLKKKYDPDDVFFSYLGPRE